MALFLLGPPRIEYSGEPAEIDRHKAIALLAYLAVTGERHSRDALATLLWPEDDQSQGRAALRRALSTLHKVLPGDWWDVDRETIGLQPGPGLWLDLDQFHDRIAKCRTHGHPAADACPDCVSPLTEAASLYRGDFLAGFTLRDSPGFDDWQFFQTESLRREQAGVLERMARIHSTQGQLEPAIGYARRWLALDSLHEEAHRQLMTLYAWSGQRNAALRQYGECSRVLEQELGVAPQEATVQLYEAIKENRAPPPTPLILRGERKPARPHDLAPLVPSPPFIESEKEPAHIPAQPDRPLSLLDRIVGGRLVGREREVAEANVLWRRALSAEGHVLLVSGEPGIGKTRLVRELATFAGVSGARVLVGECYAEGGAPYAPFAQIIREILGGPGGAVGKLDLPPFVLADLITLAPDIRLRFPDVVANPPLDPQSEQQRLFESVVTLCDELAAGRPLLLIVEDVHWADTGTLLLLRYLARRTRKLPLLTIMTYRDAEVELDEARILNEVLLDLNRERLAVHLKLSRLNREQTRELLAALFAEEISQEFLEGIYRETEGNPFFVEEVCKGLIEEGKLYYEGGRWHRPKMEEIEIPQSVRMAIQSRVRKLLPQAQAALHVAAVLGREFDFDTLKGASEFDEEVLIAALESAARAQLIGEVSRAGRVKYAFAHALIPFTLRESLSGLRLQRLHLRAAAAIEALRSDDFEALAHHFAAAGEREKAVTYSREAARRAEAVYAHDVAIRHLRTALYLIEVGDQIETRLAVLEQLADVYGLLGERTEALQIYRGALDLWRRLPGADKWIAARLHRKILQRTYGIHYYASFEQRREMSQAGAASRASLEGELHLAGAEPLHPEMVRLLAALSDDARETRFPPDLDAAERFARAAVAMAEQLDAPVELSAALDALASVYGARGLFRERVQVSLRRLALSQDPRFGDLRERVSTLLQIGAGLMYVGEYAHAIPYLLEAETLGGQIRDVEDQVYAQGLQGESWFRLDRWDDMFNMEEKWRDLLGRHALERIGAMCYYIALSASVHALRGEFDRAASLREEAYAIMVDYSGPPEQWVRNQHY